MDARISLPFLTKPWMESTVCRDRMAAAYRMDESDCINTMLDYLSFSDELEHKTSLLAKQLITKVRQQSSERTLVEMFMMQYDLSTEEGVMLMCLAEALLRVPDKETERLLIQDKLSSAEWNKQIGVGGHIFIKLLSKSLSWSGKILKEHHDEHYFKKIWRRLVRKSGEPMIRKAVREAMRLLSEQFVLGRNMPEALKRSEDFARKGYTFSYDMLGEVARTQKDADRYFKAYEKAVAALKPVARPQDLLGGPSISVKLSALYPRYEFAERESAVPFLIERMTSLLTQAKNYGVTITLDAEEADRLDMSLDIFEALFRNPLFKDWEGFGLAVQAYQRRAFYLIDWLVELSRSENKRVQVRLVKGAYWDSEIKMAQVDGMSNYPVFTRKVNTDVSYLACAKKMLSYQAEIYPQFATHNAYSVAALLSIMGDDFRDYEFEFQSLHGMGKPLHDQIVDKKTWNALSRIYAPVGSHQELLPYLVRRLLENGANSSFVNRILDPEVPIEELIVSPVQTVRSLNGIIAHPRIPLPKDIYGLRRLNSRGLDLSDLASLQHLAEGFKHAEAQSWEAAPFSRHLSVGAGQPVCDPSDRRRQVGRVEKATETEALEAIQRGVTAFENDWQYRCVKSRAELLRKAADALEADRDALMYLLVREAGKTLNDAVSEVREAIDFCRYYAEQAELTLSDMMLPGPTGESNVLSMRGRGLFFCISPWNFPLAIFLGQVTAALAAGNTVIAKPADQTPLIAARAIALLHQAGFPKDVVQFLPGRGSVIGSLLVKHPSVSGVMMTGSTETGKSIAQMLAEKPGPIVPLVAETGGMNAMIVDSTALPEQVVRDVITSSFRSAGQRCSALRVLFLQSDIADKVIEMLAGAMAELKMGDSLLMQTDVGPVIDAAAAQMLQEHADRMMREAKLIYRVELPADCAHGSFFPPMAFELPKLSLLEKEVFGPILHIIRFERAQLDQVINDINALGYGLTFGIHSRITTTQKDIARRIRAGNVYVNRNMIGAVVGVQPFGGLGLSGTGPKAGGPHYLARLATEVTVTIDTTAAGGNASLMASMEG